MENKVKSPTAFNLALTYKRKFSFWELYQALVFIPRAIIKLIANSKSKLVSAEFIERLQLAVTEVNGCPACSYQHTKMALKLGMTNDEISSFLSGGKDYILPEEAKAIAFAQHFAESRAFPKSYAYKSIVDEYGTKKANIILSAVQVMVTGNIYGLPLSAFQSRLNGEIYKDSSLFYELGMLFGGLLLIPFAFVHGILRSLIGKHNKRLDSSTDENEL